MNGPLPGLLLRGRGARLLAEAGSGRSPGRSRPWRRERGAWSWSSAPGPPGCRQRPSCAAWAPGRSWCSTGSRSRRRPPAQRPHRVRPARPAPASHRPGVRARAWRRRRGAAGAELRTGATVTGWAGPDGTLAVTWPRRAASGRAAAAVVLATGCRERPRPARLVPGDRPAGVLTTGQLQQLVLPGRGAARPGGPWWSAPSTCSCSAVLTLRTPAPTWSRMVTEHERQQSLRRVPVRRGGALAGAGAGPRAP